MEDKQIKQFINEHQKLINDNELIKDLCIIKEHNNSRLFDIPYLDFKKSNDYITLNAYYESVELKDTEIKISGPIDGIVYKDIDIHNLFLSSVLNEKYENILKRVCNIIYKNGNESYLKTWNKSDLIKNKITVFLSKYMSFLKTKIYNKSYKIKASNISDVLICIKRKISLHSYKMFSENRFGNADIIITNCVIGSLLLDDISFEFDNIKNDKINYSHNGIYYVGKYLNCKLFIDPYLKYDDNSIYLITSPKNDSPGIRYIYNGNNSNLQTIRDNGFGIKYILNTTDYIDYVGSNNLMIDKICIDMPKNIF